MSRLQIRREAFGKLGESRVIGMNRNRIEEVLRIVIDQSVSVNDHEVRIVPGGEPGREHGGRDITPYLLSFELRCICLQI